MFALAGCSSALPNEQQPATGAAIYRNEASVDAAWNEQMKRDWRALGNAAQPIASEPSLEDRVQRLEREERNRRLLEAR